MKYFFFCHNHDKEVDSIIFWRQGHFFVHRREITAHRQLLSKTWPPCILPLHVTVTVWASLFPYVLCSFGPSEFIIFTAEYCINWRHTFQSFLWTPVGYFSKEWVSCQYHENLPQAPQSDIAYVWGEMNPAL